MMNAVTAIKTTEKFVSSERSKTAWRTGVSPAPKFDRFRKSDHADLGHLRKLYGWLFVPITLWPIDIEALFRAALDRASSRKRLDRTMILLINLLPSLPSERTQRTVLEHEHAVQQGNYELLIRARHKYDEIESELAQKPMFQAEWNSIKARFDVTKFADHKGIIPIRESRIASTDLQRPSKPIATTCDSVIR